MSELKPYKDEFGFALPIIPVTPDIAAAFIRKAFPKGPECGVVATGKYGHILAAIAQAALTSGVEIVDLTPLYIAAHAPGGDDPVETWGGVAIIGFNEETILAFVDNPEGVSEASLGLIAEIIGGDRRDN